MSYNVVILQPPVPSDDAAAWKAMQQICMASPEGDVPPLFHQLIDRLTARHPCICDLPDDQVDDGVWSDGPLRNNATHAVTVLGITSSRVDEVQPFVVQTANDLGLVVFDEQAGTIYRPKKGRVWLPSPARKPWWKIWA